MLSSKLMKAVHGSAPSMVPKALQDEIAPPPPKVDEAPDIRELVSDRKLLNELSKLIDQSDEWGKVEREAAKAREPINKRIKQILGEQGIGRMQSNNKLVSYFSITRSTIKPERLLEQGVSPVIITAATDITESFTLKITEKKEV